MRKPAVAPIALVLGVCVLALSALDSTSAQAPPPPPVRPTPYCPTGLTLTLSTPPQVTVGSRTTAIVTLSQAVNFKPALAGDPTSLQLFYFVDNLVVPPGFTIMPGDSVSTVDFLPDIPNRTPKIIESSSTAQDLGILPPDRHQIAVVLGQADRTSCGISASTSMFVVPPLPLTAAPAGATPQAQPPLGEKAPAVLPPTTGDAGLASTAANAIDGGNVAVGSLN